MSRPNLARIINPTTARIFRITHIDNIPWILSHGIHCRNAPADNLDQSFQPIGIPELIDRRLQRQVPIPPFGALADYVPFYFTPFSPMLLMVKTGRGVTQRPMGEIVILVSALSNLQVSGVRAIFTDRHAYLQTAEFYSSIVHLSKIDWDILQRRDFKREDGDLDKLERYQAEALAYRWVPLSGLSGIVCHDAVATRRVECWVQQAGVELKTVQRPEWYF